METAEYDESKKIADQGIEIIMKARKIIKGQPLDAPEENESSAGASTSIDSQSYTSISADGTSIKVEQKTEIHTEVNIGQ